MRTQIATCDGESVVITATDHGLIYLSHQPGRSVRLKPEEALAISKALRVYGELFTLDH